MRIFLLCALAACSSGTTGTDAGVDASNDVTQSQDASNDASSSDAATTDASSDVTQSDGGLAVGDTCDPKNNQCAQGLLCCNEPTIDGGTGYFCEKPVQKQCPLLP